LASSVAGVFATMSSPGIMGMMGGEAWTWMLRRVLRSV
jgi:hypothetical protein